MPFPAGGAAAPEKIEPAVEALRELRHGHAADSRGGELDRQGQPVETPELRVAPGSRRDVAGAAS
jgi:hypothetical protein